MRGTRGQAFTLEGLFGAFVLLTAVLFALNSAVLLPSTGETGNQADIEQEAADIMHIAAEGDEEGDWLSQTIRCYDDTEGQWTWDETSNEFGVMLDETFDQRDRSYNIEVADDNVEYSDTASRVFYQGASTRDGVSVTRTVTLYNDDELLGPDCDPEHDGTELQNTGDGYPIGDPDDPEGDEIYAVVEVRLTIR